LTTADHYLVTTVMPITEKTTHQPADGHAGEEWSGLSAENNLPFSPEEQIAKLKKELLIEKDLTKILLKQQKEWSQLIESVTPTIEMLGKKIKRLQIDLHSKNQELTNVLESLSSGLIVTDLNGKVRTFNRAAVAITGIAFEQALDRNINRLVNWNVLPESLDEGALTLISRNYRQQFVFHREDGREIIIDSATTLMRSDQSEIEGIILNLNDITQLKRLEEEAERKNRLTAMGEIAMQVAHEIRNPLGSIELFLSMLKMDLAEHEDEIELVQHIASAAKSMNHIISNLLEYTKPRPVILEPLDLHQLLADFIGFAHFSATQHGIEIDTAFDASPSKIRGNVELLKQVFHNLFVNACQAMPEGGRFSIATVRYDESEPLILERFGQYRQTEAGTVSLVRIDISDTGKGMSEDVKRRIFDPFFTTREKGTGLGMSIVFKTMTSHGGTILVHSAINKGTRISLLFPQLSPDEIVDPKSSVPA
jgi:PAS domain S-box-containing protein